MGFYQGNVPNQNVKRKCVDPTEESNTAKLKGRGDDQKPIHVSHYDYRERKDVRRKYRTAKSIRQTLKGWLVWM